jgi:hypothetical protein
MATVQMATRAMNSLNIICKHSDARARRAFPGHSSPLMGGRTLAIQTLHHAVALTKTPTPPKEQGIGGACRHVI